MNDLSSGPGDSAWNHDPRMAQVIEQAMQKLASRCLLVDVRPPAEFRAARIRGSVNIPIDEIEKHADRIRSLARGRDVGLVSQSGLKAGRAASILERCSSLEIHVVDGGVDEWKNAGLPLVLSCTGTVH